MNRIRLATIETLMANVQQRAAELNRTDPIPTCPDWDVNALINHLAIVLSRMRVRIETNADPNPTTLPSTPPDGLTALEWLALSYRELTTTFLNHEPDDPAWNWTGEDQVVGWYLRRLTHELAIHLIDLDTASPSPAPPEKLGIDVPLATDGLDELLTVFLPTRIPQTLDPMGHNVLMLQTTDGEELPWYIELDGTELSASRDTKPTDATIEGSSVSLYLFGWNRPAVDLTVTGDLTVVHDFSRIPR